MRDPLVGALAPTAGPGDARGGRGLRAGGVGSRRSRLDRASELVTVSAMGVTSVLNYAYTLTLIWLLPARGYAVFGSASALLLVCGTISAASVPWVLAAEVVNGRYDAGRRRAAVSFCLLATLAESVLAGGIVAAIASAYGGGGVVAAVVGSVAAIFSAASVVGYLQGDERFAAIAVLRVAEVVVKIALGTALVLSGAGAAGALAGYAAGAGVVILFGGRYVLPDLRVLRASLGDARLWRAAGGLVSVQGGVAVVASADIVVGSLMIGDRARLATYLVAQVFARIPVYVATGLSMVAFARLAGLRHITGRAVAEVLRLQLVVSVPIAVAVATVPRALIGVVFPAGYGQVTSILAATAAGGAMMGVINLVTTFFQAAGMYRRPATLLGVGLVVQAGAVATGTLLGGVHGLAVGSACGGTLVAAGLLRLLHATWPSSLAGLIRPLAAALAASAPLVVLRGIPSAWMAWATVGVGVPVVVALARARKGQAAPEGKPRVLHFAIEDPAQPAAGGGSVRTHEINRRLVEEFDITVVCACYDGARSRVEDGVRYVHIGAASGPRWGPLSYFASIPLALLRHPSELVVEDFNAPLSSIALPWMTRRPTVAVVQWLFARQKAAQYGLPFHLVERVGVRSHSRMIAVSDELGSALRRRNPGSEVTVVSNGLDDEAFELRRMERHGIVYMGRLEIAQKGLDMLLSTFAAVADRIEEDLCLAGDGPDEEALKSMAAGLGVADRVRFLGRVAYEDRMDLVASAILVVMPSRYETFGMVAAEAMAQQTPVLAFDIPCLRSLLAGGAGITVPAFDVDEFGRQMCSLLSDPALRADMGRRGRAGVAPLHWDALAPLQAAVYRRALDQAPGRRRRRRAAQPRSSARKEAQVGWPPGDGLDDDATT